MSSGDGGLGALTGMIKPLARKMATRENIDKVFEDLVADAELEDGEKAVLIVNRGGDGVIKAGVYVVDTSRHIRRCCRSMPVEELIMELL